MMEAPAISGSKKRKAAAAVEMEAAPEKTAPKKRKQVSQSEEKTSTVEKALTKPLYSSEKLVLMGPQGRSSGLSVAFSRRWRRALRVEMGSVTLPL
jgi:hypothetical protein